MWNLFDGERNFTYFHNGKQKKTTTMNRQEVLTLLEGVEKLEAGDERVLINGSTPRVLPVNYPSTAELMGWASGIK